MLIWNDRFWPEADPENWSFAGVKASAFGKSGHSLFTASFSLNSPDSQAVTSPSAGDSVAMFTEIYIEALLVDEVLADHLLLDPAGKCQF